jgi:hypothetical protein
VHKSGGVGIDPHHVATIRKAFVRSAGLALDDLFMDAEGRETAVEQVGKSDLLEGGITSRHLQFSSISLV